jgi:hypothetical protein
VLDLFGVAWGMRNETEHGADLETQRMIRLAKRERAIRRLFHESVPLLFRIGIPFMNRWKTYSPKLSVFRNARSV